VYKAPTHYVVSKRFVSEIFRSPDTSLDVSLETTAGLASITYVMNATVINLNSSYVESTGLISAGGGEETMTDKGPWL